MKELDEAEKLAREHLDNKTPPLVSCCDIARALLAVVPVVRAAEEVKRGCDCEYDYRCGRCQAVCDLNDAIDQMRLALGGK